MSIFGAMFSGVTGLDAQSQALGMIADNISNVNTVGYKATTTRFSTLVTESASRTRFTPGGVQSLPAQGIDRQGLLQSSTSRTDVAIAGRGFFVVNESAKPGVGNEFLFTRAGSFNPDENGNLINTAGYFLQGWPLTNGTTLPTNTSVLTSVQTVNVSNLAGTASPTTSVDLALNLPSTAAAATGGGQINTKISASTLAGITDIDYKAFGTLGQVAKLTYDSVLKRITLDIGGQTGVFDVSAQTATTYTSTGTLAGMEITLDTNFNYNTSVTTQTNTITETNRTGTDTADFTQATNLNGIQTMSFNSVVSNNDIITVDFDSVSGTLTVRDQTTGDTGSVIIGTTGGNGVKDFTLTGGTLAGTVVTIDTNVFNFTTSFNNTINASTGVRSGASTDTNGVTISSFAIGSLDAAALRKVDTGIKAFTLTITEAAGADGIAISNNTGSVFTTATITAGDVSAGATTMTINVSDGTDSFDVTFNTSGAVSAGNTLVVDVTLNEILNKVAAENDNLVVAATTPTISSFDANDLAAIDKTAITFNVDAKGRVVMESGPTGFSVNQSQSDSFATAGNRNIVLTDGTNTFTVTLNVTTPITAGSADVAVDLLELTNSVGLGSPIAGGQFSSTVQIFDSLGNAHDLEIQYLKEATNQWTITVLDPVLASTGAKSGTVVNATRSIVFNGDGTPQTITFPDVRITGWTTGAIDSTVAIKLGTTSKADGVTQFAGEFSISSIDQDGVRFGGFVGVNISETGVVTAVFDNGEQLAIYKLPVAIFANPNGLETVSGNAFRQTDTSGDILLQQANSGGAGTVASSALESSTVDLAEEFTKMITTQRAYSASARIITTADEMLEELIRIRR
ncbi:MAG: flagellar hook-basal body complex protein [Kiloniellaceae bacterium]